MAESVADYHKRLAHMNTPDPTFDVVAACTRLARLETFVAMSDELCLYDNPGDGYSAVQEAYGEIRELHQGLFVGPRISPRKLGDLSWFSAQSRVLQKVYEQAQR